MEPTQRAVMLECEVAELTRKLADAHAALRVASTYILRHCGETQMATLKAIRGALPNA